MIQFCLILISYLSLCFLHFYRKISFFFYLDTFQLISKSNSVFPGSAFHGNRTNSGMVLSPKIILMGMNPKLVLGKYDIIRYTLIFFQEAGKIKMWLWLSRNIKRKENEIFKITFLSHSLSLSGAFSWIKSNPLLAREAENNRASLLAELFSNKFTATTGPVGTDKVS